VSACYLIRLDDACATMRRDRWSRVEAILDAHGVQPIVAVVPDNRDPALDHEQPDTGFWDRVRAWAAKGWNVAMHGYQHVMHATDSRLVLPFYRRSEFAGLDLEAQARKIAASWQLFAAQGVRPDVWVAPAHSFDLLTLRAVRRETPIRIVSDGISSDTWFEHDLHWIPQQLWSLAPRPWGVWTVCLHPNTMDEAALDSLDRSLAAYRGRLTRVCDVPLRSGRKSVLGRLYGRYFWWRWRRATQAS